LRILLTGRNGQVGWELERVLKATAELCATDRTSLDLNDNDAIRSTVRDVKPDVIINAAAYTAVDKAEAERELATQINAVAPGVLAEEAKRQGALLMHYSTDYVFDGNKRSPYTEDDMPNPLSHYARTKLEGERAISASGCRHLILRTSWVYGPRTRNFYRIIADKARANEPMRMVDDQTSVPTPARFLALSTSRLLEAGNEGLLHVVSTGESTRYRFACEVVTVTRSRSSVGPARTSEFPAAATRPSYSVMANRRAAKILGMAIPAWEAALRTAITEWNY
jgi:dTDP-4-dehydrorhamnose reductase